MSEPKTLMVNDVKYVREYSINTANDSGPKDIRIVVLQRGWVVVGEYRSENGQVFVENASVIRRWGTTEGIGELAKKGRLPNTVLDKCNGTVQVNDLAVVLTVKCEAAKW
jgi:hypothetical protein